MIPGSLHKTGNGGNIYVGFNQRLKKQKTKTLQGHLIDMLHSDCTIRSRTNILGFYEVLQLVSLLSVLFQFQYKLN